MPDNRHMPRRKTRRSYNTPGHVHFLTFSCVNRWPLLASDRSRTWCVDAIRRARRRNGFSLYAWVIMPEHVHMLVRPEDGVAIEAVLRGVKQSVSRTAMNWLRANDPAWTARLTVRRPDGRSETRFWLPSGGYDRNITKPPALRRTVE